MLDFQLKIGLVPGLRNLGDFKTRKGFFEPPKGAARKDVAVAYIKEHFTDENTSFCDLEWLNELGVLYLESDCEKVRDYLKAEKVDAIVLLNCNFGNEEAFGRLAKLMGVPVLLWGPRDTSFEPNGIRYTDSQCGLFAIGNQLNRYHVPFSYIENCHVEEPAFTEGFTKFLSVACMVKNFRKLAITTVGTRLNPFKSVMYNELELTEKFGFNLQTVNLAKVQAIFQSVEENNGADLDADLAWLKANYNVGSMDDGSLKKMLTLVHVYKQIFQETGADVLTSECWSALPLAVGANPCLAMSILYDMGYIVVCESDVHGAVTSAMLTCAARGKKATLFGEFTARHPENDNAELLWHCGPFPLSSKKESCEACILNGKPAFVAKDGVYTIARFQGAEGNYTMFGGNFRTVDGPYTSGTYLWAEFNDLPKLERKLVEGPYIHHMTEIEGDYTEVLKEFCKFVPALTYDPAE